MTSVLSVRDLCFSWPGRDVLSNMSFEIKPKQIVSILGVNGAGKTTLLKCINRILKPTHGSINLQSNDVGEMSIIDIAKHVAYVPQSVSTSFPLSLIHI